MLGRKNKIEIIMQELSEPPDAFKVFVNAFTAGGQTNWTAWVSWRKAHDEIRLNTIATGDSPLNALENLRGQVGFQMQALGVLDQ